MSSSADTGGLMASAGVALTGQSSPAATEVPQFVTSTAQCDNSKRALTGIVAIQSQAIRLSVPDDAVARTTPERSLTDKELHLLQKPEDVTAVQLGPNVMLVKDHVVGTVSQSMTTHEMLAVSQPKPFRPSDQISVPAMQRRGRGITLLTAIDPGNIIDPGDNEVGDSGIENSPTSSLSTSKYLFRNRKADQSKLVYDVKYHPMDDDIRPTQAAKRRLAHGEIDSISYDPSRSLFGNGEASIDDKNVAGISTDEEEDQDESKSKKRRRCQNWPLEPTRQSSRKISEARVSYDMSKHPQDEELEMLKIELDSEEGDEDNVESDSSSIWGRSPGYIGAQLAAGIDADITNPGWDCTTGGDDDDYITEEERSETEALAMVTETSPSSTVATPHPRSVRRREGLDVWMLEPGERYFRHDRDTWVASPSLPFHVHTERLEDQLAADANTPLPCNFDHDDKENDDASFASEQASNVGMTSIMPASLYRRTSEDSHASCERLMVDRTLYDFDHNRSPYGFGGNDGTQEQRGIVLDSTFANEYLSLLVSGRQLPRGPNTKSEAGNKSVLEPEPSTSTVVDSSQKGASLNLRRECELVELVQRDSLVVGGSRSSASSNSIIKRWRTSPLEPLQLAYL